MELSDEAKKEFRDAIRILREDGFHVHRTAEAYAARQRTDATKKPAAEDATDKPEEGNPPPVKEKTEEDVKPPKDWWFGARGN